MKSMKHDRDKLGFLPGLLLIALCLLGVSSAFAEEPGAPEQEEKKKFGISIGPSIIRLQGNPGETQSADVKVWNRGIHPTKVLVEALDLGNSLKEGGRLQRIFPPAGTLPYSCAKWVIVREKEFILGAGESRTISNLVSAPADARGGKSAVLFFVGMPMLPVEGEEPGQAQPSAKVQVLPRLGSLVFYDVAGTVVRSGKMHDFQVLPPSDSPHLGLRYEFENTGNADILVTGTFYVLDQDSVMVAKDTIDAARTFPGDRGVVETRWKGVLPPGNYHMVASFELKPDLDQVIVKEVDFSIPAY